MEKTPIKTQLKNMRMELCRMLDRCHDICPHVTPMNVAQNHCRNCDHGRHMREAMKRIEELQRKDRAQRGVKVWSDSIMPGSPTKPDVKVKRSHKDKADPEKTVELPMNAFTFSKRYSTFDEWLSSQKQPYSDYVSGIIRLHEKYPTTTRDELAEIYHQRMKGRKTK